MRLDEVLTIRAGTAARRAVADRGIVPQRIGAIAGAAGGPKWLVLSALDRYLFGEWLPGAGSQPIELVGASVGAWRLAAACHVRDPAGAIDRLEQAYLAQSYSARADRDEISGTTRTMLDRFMSDEVIDGVLTHPRYRLHAITVRSRCATRCEARRRLMAGSGLAAAGNLVSRRSLAGFFERVVFSRNRGHVVWARDGLGGRSVGLTAANVRDAVYASGSVPLVMRGVVDPPGAPPGVYRDGGIVDYHIDHPILEPASEAPIVLMPHFDARLVPGWFDKHLRCRRARHAHHTLMIGPGPALTARLVDGRVPDRRDFYRYAGADDRRLAAWRQAIEAGQLMRDAFIELCRDPDPARYLEPI